MQSRDQIVLELIRNIKEKDEAGVTALLSNDQLQPEDLAAIVTDNGKVSNCLVEICKNPSLNIFRAVLNKLAKKQIDIYMGQTIEKWRPLDHLFSNAQLDTVFVRILINHRVHLHKPAQNNWTTLHMACRYYAGTEIVRLLLEHKADVNAVATNNYTALHIAFDCQAGPEIVKLLLAHKADVNAVTKANWTTLHAACANQAGHEIVRLLLAHKADINAVDKDNSTALHAACANQAGPEVVRLLLEHKADVNAVDKGNSTALHAACRYYAGPEVVRLLLEHKADVNAVDKDSSTALHAACRYQAGPEVVRLLLEHKADVNAVDKDNWTPLQIACRYSTLRLVLLLVETDQNFRVKLKLPVAQTRDDKDSKNTKDIVGIITYVEALECLENNKISDAKKILQNLSFQPYLLYVYLERIPLLAFNINAKDLRQCINESFTNDNPVSKCVESILAQFKSEKVKQHCALLNKMVSESKTEDTVQDLDIQSLLDSQKETENKPLRDWYISRGLSSDNGELSLFPKRSTRDERDVYLLYVISKRSEALEEILAIKDKEFVEYLNASDVRTPLKVIQDYHKMVAFNEALTIQSRKGGRMK